MNLNDISSLLSGVDRPTKQKILSQPCSSEIAAFEGQTLGQHLFKLASDIVDEQHTQKNGLSLQEFMKEHNHQRDDILKSVVGEDYFSDYMHDLQILRDKKAAEIMQETQHLYHFSQNTPETMGPHIIPKPQLAGNALSENIGQALCYAANTDESHYIVKPPSNEKEKWEGVACYMDEKVVLVSGYNPEDFLQRQQLSYCYEVNKSSFKPNIHLDGRFTNEYESERPAEIIGIKGPFSVVDMCSSRDQKGWDIPLYFCPDKEDKKFIKQKIDELRGIGSTRKEALKQISLEYPDKLIYFNENQHLTDYAKSLPIEQQKSEEQNKVAKLNEDLKKQQQAKKNMNTVANLLMIKRGFKNPRNQAAMQKIAVKKEQKTGQALTDIEIKIAKIKAAGKGK